MDKVLFISYYFPPAGGGNIVRSYTFVKYLPSTGISPFVLTVDEKYYPSFIKDDTLLQALDANHVKIFRTASFGPKGSAFDSFQARIYGLNGSSNFFQKYGKPLLRWLYRFFIIPDEQILWAPHAIREGKHIIEHHQIDAIFATTPPHSSGIIGAALSRLTQIPLIIDVRDDWIGNPLFDNGSRHNRFISRLLEKWVIMTASKVITVTVESSALFQQKYTGQPANKFQVIFNGFDAQDFPEMSGDRPNHCKDRLRIIYTGGLPIKRSPVALFQALKELASDLPIENIFQIDFYGNTRQEYIDAALQMGLEKNVKFHNFVSRKESLEQLISSDSSLMIIPEEEGSQTAIPGKIYEYLGARKFVLALCPPQSAPARLVKAMNLGIVAPPGDVEAIKTALREMFSRFKNDGLGINLPSNILKQFERSAQTERLAESLRQVVKQ
jgi:glycosyltransferase involved in cell wall biosynthesis